jgi:hypothetical protein
VGIWSGCNGEQGGRSVEPKTCTCATGVTLAWLAGCVALDSKGFIKTGLDLSPEEGGPLRWHGRLAGDEPARRRLAGARKHAASAVAKAPGGVCAPGV